MADIAVKSGEEARDVARPGLLQKTFLKNLPAK
jgi:hypothetical protein